MNREGVRRTETRTQKSRRGFYERINPPVFGVNEAFNNVAMSPAIRRVFAKYALLDEHGEPIEAVAKLFAQSNFGYGDDPTQGMRSGDPTFGADMGMPMETGDRNGLSRGLSYGGV